MMRKQLDTYYNASLEVHRDSNEYPIEHER